MVKYSKSAKSSHFRTSCSVRRMTPIADIVQVRYTPLILVTVVSLESLILYFLMFMVLVVYKLPKFAQHH